MFKTILRKKKKSPDITLYCHECFVASWIEFWIKFAPHVKGLNLTPSSQGGIATTGNNCPWCYTDVFHQL